ncbi:MAG: hypothetical protein K0R17_2731 [Rariglobus sp.]|nr:hypothetical protein [Rariglobus sp.]
MSPETLATALANHRLETARRIGFALLAEPVTCTPAAVLGTHDALAALAELHEATALLASYAGLLRAESFAVALRLAEDTHNLARDSHYRLSAEARAGFTLEEYLARYHAAANDRFGAALRLAETPTQYDALRASFRRCRRPLPPELTEPPAPPPATAPVPASGQLRGALIFPDDTPVAHALVTLGLAVEVKHPDPRTYLGAAPDYAPVVGPLGKLTTTTSARGEFQFPSVPAGRHEFLAVTLDPAVHAIPTRFIARDLAIVADSETDLGNLTVTEWQSAPPATWQSPHSSAGILAEHRLHNPFYYDFRLQPLRLPLPAGFDPATQALRVEIEPGRPEPHQIVGHEVALMAALPMRSRRSVAFYATDSEPPATDTRLRLIKESPEVWQLDTGTAQFRIPGPTAATDAPPLLAVRGADQRWRGRGRFVLPPGITITHRSTELLQLGPILIELRVAYTLNNGSCYLVHLTALDGEPVLEVHEIAPALEGAAFEFSLAEFSGGRTFRHWTRESPDGGRHWYPLEAKDALVAALPESVPWWVPPQFFAAAVTPDSLAERDYLAVMSLRRGEWIDRAFARISQGPVDADGSPNHELDWPYPEMLGSSISQITAHTTADGDVFFRFGFFDGERRWGLYAGAFEANDGPWKEMSAVQHAHSSPRLQDFKDWHFDVADTDARPHVVATRGQLIPLRAKTRHPRFARLWQKIRGEKPKVRGPGLGLAFALDGDPLIAWRKRIDFLCIAEIRSRMTLLGRDWSDMYSPVLGRPITEWVEEYDLIAASGVFSPEEERSVRAFFILMGHMFMETDFMNWQFGGRNANFEADRADIVGAIGIVFDGHPDAEKFQRHVIELTKRALVSYCTPGSGKWHENPACYYLQNAKCRMNLVYHLVAHGRLSLDEIPLLRDFLRWGILLLTPPHPVAYATMRDGQGSDLFDRVEKVRKIAPVGDHATIGRWLPEHYATIGKLFRSSDPVFAEELLNSYFVANADGARLVTRYARPVEQEGEQLFHDIYSSATFGNLPLFFTVIEEPDIPEAPAITLASRRLEGFGAVLRQGFNTDREGYVLLKQGPGGYRYHRTEGSLIFFADGKPLIFDGGEAGETWRHSTLSFHDVHMPLMPGRLERIFATPAIQFTQGTHAGAVAPGEPAFLSDNASHTLIGECYRRWNQSAPGVVRSLAWLGGRTLIVHDAIHLPANIPSHWHLQVVGGVPAGDPASGYVFPGRFGTDLQVLFPGQVFAAARVENLPIHEYRGTPADWFAMQHLQVTAPGARHYLAVLHPLDSTGPVSAEPLRDGDRIIGARVRGAGTGADHRVWFSRSAVSTADADHTFAGGSGALLRSPAETVLCVIGPGRLEHGGWSLESTGPEASLTVAAQGARLVAQGAGQVHLRHQGRHQTFDISGPVNLALS